MTAAPRICVVGSLNMDLVVRSPRLPVPGETVIGGPFETFPGGKGANQAVAAARLGATVAMVGAVGEDEFGEVLRTALGRDAIEPRLERRADTATGVALITVDAKGENTIVVAPGANAAVGTELLQVHQDVIRDADALVCQLEVSLEAVERAAEIARSHRTRVVLNAAPAQPLPAALLQATDVLIVNRGEACTVAGSDAPVETLAATLRDLGPELVVITLGTEGAVAHDGRTLHVQPAFRVESIDAVAAGDAFVGALAVELATGHPLPDALRTACAAGALATTRRGAQPSLPDRQAVDAFLHSIR